MLIICSYSFLNSSIYLSLFSNLLFNSLIFLLFFSTIVELELSSFEFFIYSSNWILICWLITDLPSKSFFPALKREALDSVAFSFNDYPYLRITVHFLFEILTKRTANSCSISESLNLVRVLSFSYFYFYFSIKFMFKLAMTWLFRGFSSSISSARMLSSFTDYIYLFFKE